MHAHTHKKHGILNNHIVSAWNGHSLDAYPLLLKPNYRTRSNLDGDNSVATTLIGTTHLQTLLLLESREGACLQK